MNRKLSKPGRDSPEFHADVQLARAHAADEEGLACIRTRLSFSWRVGLIIAKFHLKYRRDAYPTLTKEIERAMRSGLPEDLRWLTCSCWDECLVISRLSYLEILQIEDLPRKISLRAVKLIAFKIPSERLDIIQVLARSRSRSFDELRNAGEIPHVRRRSRKAYDDAREVRSAWAELTVRARADDVAQLLCRVIEDPLELPRSDVRMLMPLLRQTFTLFQELENGNNKTKYPAGGLPDVHPDGHAVRERAD